MTIADAFGSYSGSGSKFVNTALVTFSLIGIQAILDSAFECPSGEYSPVLASIYCLSFFFCPAIVFVFIGLYYFPGFHKKQCCPCWTGNWACVYVALKVGRPAVFWLLIAMTDGRYLSCLVVVVSNYQLDHNLFLFIFQTSGMLAITVMVILWYYVSKCTCPCLEDSRRTYEMLADVENILVQDETEKEKNAEKQKFLCALEHDGKYMDRKLPKYIRDKEDLLSSKLKPPNAANAGNANADH